MPQLEPLHLKITGSADGLSSAYREAQSKTQGFGLSINGIAGKLGNLGSVAGPAGAAAAAALAAVTAAAGVAAVAAGKVAENLKSIDAAADAANRLGLSFAELKGTRFSLARATGLDDGTIDSAITKLEVNLGQAAKDGAGKVHETLKELGLDAGHLMAEGPLNAIASIADRVSEITDRSRQAQVVFDLMGKSGIAIAAAFRQSGENLRENYNWAKDNLGLTEQQVAQAGLALDRWDEVFAVIQHIAEVFSAEMAPLVELIAEDILGVASAVGGVEGAAREAAEAMAMIYGVTKDLFELWKGQNPIVQWVRILSGEDWADIARDMWSPETWSFDQTEKTLARLEALRANAKETAAAGGLRSGFSDSESVALETFANAAEGVTEKLVSSTNALQEAQQQIKAPRAITDRAEQIRQVFELRQSQAQNDQKTANALLKQQLGQLTDLGRQMGKLIRLTEDSPAISLD